MRTVEKTVYLFAELPTEAYTECLPDDSEKADELSCCMQGVIRTLNDLVADWLESEYQYQTSDACIDELLDANEYEFNEDGSFYG